MLSQSQQLITLIEAIKEHFIILLIFIKDGIT